MTQMALTRSRIEAIADFAERKQHDLTLPAEVREALVEIRKQSRIAVAALLGREVEQQNGETNGREQQDRMDEEHLEPVAWMHESVSGM